MGRIYSFGKIATRDFTRLVICDLCLYRFESFLFERNKTLRWVLLRKQTAAKLYFIDVKEKKRTRELFKYRQEIAVDLLEKKKADGKI